MNNVLVGYTGFIGSTLLKQTRDFNILVNSRNINDLEPNTDGTVVCAAAPAKKWIANQNPIDDRNNIDLLTENLKKIKCHQFILISTIDVFQNPIDVTEDSDIDVHNLHAYGLNRYHLEVFTQSYFDNHLIIRLPGLVGPGLRKNIIFDLLNNNNLNSVDSRSIYQFYPTVNLWFDIIRGLDNNIKILHLSAEPLSVSEVAAQGFNITFTNHVNDSFASYNFLSKYDYLWSSLTNGYQYSKQESLQAIRSYAQSEAQATKINSGV